MDNGLNLRYLTLEFILYALWTSIDWRTTTQRAFAQSRDALTHVYGQTDILSMSQETVYGLWNTVWRIEWNGSVSHANLQQKLIKASK